MGVTQAQKQHTIHCLRTERCSCAVCRDGEVKTYWEKGVKDLYRLVKEQPEELAGAFVADKVIGKGAAALLVLGKVDEVFAEVISAPALALLETYGIEVGYTDCVPNIINRSHTGICPVEELCKDCRTAEDCLPQIENFIKSGGPIEAKK